MGASTCNWWTERPVGPAETRGPIFDGRIS
jgi:hypothetical protein